MSQIFNKNRRTKKNSKTPKEIIWENKEKNDLQLNLFIKVFAKLIWIILNLFRYILYPFCDFKIGLLYSDKIGRFLGNTEFYLRKKSLTKNKKYRLHILIAGKTISHQILKMISREALLIHNIPFYNFLNEIKKMTLDSSLWIDLNITGWLRGKDWTGAKPQLNFDVDYWGTSNKSVIKHILEKDKGNKITVSNVSDTNLIINIKALNAVDRKRLRYVSVEDKPLYLVDNNYYFSTLRRMKQKKILNNYNVFYQLYVDNTLVSTVYKIK